MHEFNQRAQTIEQIILDLGQLIVPWAREQRLDKPIYRIIQRYAARLGEDAELWQDQFGELLLLYHTLNHPNRISMILKAEKDGDFPRPFTGDELQMLNNLLHYQSLICRFYTLQDEMHPDIYHVSEAVSGHDYVVVSPQLRQAVEGNRTLILSVLIPVGISPPPADHPLDAPWEDVPGFTPLGQFAAFGTYTENDVEFFGNALAGRSLSRSQFGPFIGEHLPECIFLSGLATPTADHPAMAQRLYLADFTVPEPGIDIAPLEDQFEVQRRGDWSYGRATLALQEAQDADKEAPHTMEFFYHKKNRHTIIRAVDHDAFLTLIQLLGVQSLAVPPQIDASMGMISAVQLLMDKPFPGDYIAKEFDSEF
ncbi:hypothetical protein [Spirochaeta lutea]|uniref:Uncharacterized protein n=1 Tax=Spirochaeta lutea TaxID=1480694 RepID=A0A098QTN3_9SPIO|nr:hypothetical protein [Spirochaeta lutea]KGE71099.1 hypothetical protein DC28_12665 [Spirochaeta lutea]